MRHLLRLVCFLSLGLPALGHGAAFDAVPFGLPLPEGNGILWEDPREIHRVVVHFQGSAPASQTVRLEYWGSRWPEQHLPKAREPGGGDVGWMELGNWFKGGWRAADAEVSAEGSKLSFTFHPVNAKEFPKLKNYPVDFRYTLKLRVASDAPLPKIERIEAFTDSTLQPLAVSLAWQHGCPKDLAFEVFNGIIANKTNVASATLVALLAVTNSDPNTFDRSLLTARTGTNVFTVKVDDLASGPVYLSHFGVVVLAEGDKRDYAEVAAELAARGDRTLYDRIAGMPEQTWLNAWSNMPSKKSRIYFPLGLDGGRQRFLLEPNGGVRFRLNDNFLETRPGKDTARLKLEPAPVAFHFVPCGAPIDRKLQEEVLPICDTSWDNNGIRIIQTAFVTGLEGASADGPVPAADTTAVFLARFVFTNTATASRLAKFPVSCVTADSPQTLTTGADGLLQHQGGVRGQILVEGQPSTNNIQLEWSWTLGPGESKTVIVKIPYLLLTNSSEHAALQKLNFDIERSAVAGYWRRRLSESAELLTPEPILNEFYRAQAGHLLVNCEREPDSTRRFARVGSFSYGAYGNESCMMVVDLDRRGYHREAQECLDAWLHYQGTVGLPGDFDSQEGVLYGAGGYESGGYNQHHGWILWCLAEHYRFTRDRDWLRAAAPGILAGADWIIRETRRAGQRHPLERGLLPAGSLEDIGDWWTWLSTSCYSWRGLDSAAWALEQISHPDAARVRFAADEFHAHLLANFRAAAARSPVVRLRDGTAVPHFPSQIHRRGRSFGWICETLEGALHLLITGALDPQSPEADWILKDYEDNLYLSNQYGYSLEDFDKNWFARGGMSMQACLLLDVEPYLARDDVKHALRAMFNAIAVSHFPDVHMNTEHALPHLDDWRGDHFKTSDEANACGWLRQIFVRESGNDLLFGQAVPRDWLKPGQTCGLKRAATYFGPASIVFTGAENQITAELEGPSRNPPASIRLRFRTPGERPLRSVVVNGEPWSDVHGDWVILPGTLGKARVLARY